MNVGVIKTKKGQLYFFDSKYFEKVLAHCNDKKNNFIFLKKYQKAITLDSIDMIAVEILNNEYKDKIELHKEQIQRLEQSHDENALPLL